jgi:hypothetical protein
MAAPSGLIYDPCPSFNFRAALRRPPLLALMRRPAAFPCTCIADVAPMHCVVQLADVHWDPLAGWPGGRGGASPAVQQAAAAARRGDIAPLRVMVLDVVAATPQPDRWVAQEHAVEDLRIGRQHGGALHWRCQARL